MHYYRNVRHYSAKPPQRPKYRSFKLRREFVLAGLIVVLAVSGIMMLGGDDSSQSAVLAANETKVPEKPKPAQIDQAALASAVNSLIAANPGLDIGVSIEDIQNQQSFTYGVDKLFIAASVGKLLSAVVYLDQVEHGQRTLDDKLNGITAREHIQRMVAKSDNESWHAINDELGHPTLEAYARDHGMSTYEATDNKITPKEVNVLLTGLYTRKLLNEDNTRFLLANLQQDQEEIQFIRKYVDPSISVYHKAGWLSDRAHDTAIIENGDRPIVLVIFTKSRNGTYDFQNGQALFSSFTTAVMNVMKV